MFADAGIPVVVVEAGLVGHGSSAASTALLMQETDANFTHLEARYGAAAARRIWELGHEATQDFVSTLRRFRIPCDLSERDSLYFASRPDAARELSVEFKRRRAAGLNQDWLDRRALQTAGILGEAAVRTRGNARLNPIRACVGLLRSAQRRGAQIFERSPVQRVRYPRHLFALGYGGNGMTF